MILIFKNIDSKRQIKYNIFMEETCGLLLEISNIILMDFTQYLEKFTSIQPPSKERLQCEEVKDEESNFYYNIKLFNEIFAYLKGCYEVYLILIRQLDDLILPYNTFIKLLQFLSRSRLSVTNLIFTAQNALKNYNIDQKNVNKYIDLIKNINKEEENMIIEGKDNAPIKKKKINKSIPKANLIANDRMQIDLSEKIRQQFIFRLNEETQKSMRIKNILNKLIYNLLNKLFNILYDI
jgi:hypothetical protein